MISVYYVLPFLEYKMLQICEECAFNYKITFNATKSQLLYFSYLDKDHNDLLNLTMKDGNVIPYVSKCVHIGISTIYTTFYRDNVIDVVNQLYKRTNYLLSDFSFERCTVSYLFYSYCMNLYSCQVWRLNNMKHLKAIHGKLIMTYYIVLLIVYI